MLLIDIVAEEYHCYFYFELSVDQKNEKENVFES